MSKRSIQYNTESAIINHLNINVDAYFNSHFEGGGHVQYKVSLIKLNNPKRPDHAFFTSVWVMWAQMSSPEASSEPEEFLT